MRLLQTIYTKSGLAESDDQAASTSHVLQDPRFRRLGFSSEAPALEADFANVGLFGLYTLYYLATNRSDDFSEVS